MKKSRKILSGIMALCLMGTIAVIPESIVSVTATAESADTSVTWAFDNESGVLTISGTGEMMKIDRFNASPWQSESTSIKAVVIENGITNISSQAFQGCNNLEKVTLPESIISIGSYAFSNCTKLNDINIPTHIETIERNAFGNCQLLSVPIIFPETLTSIGESIFNMCTSLTTVSLPSSLTVIPKYAFQSCSSLENISISAGTATISDYAFAECGKLSDITIPDTVTEIDSRAFIGCKNLVNLTMPDSIEKLGQEIFFDCSNLESVKLSNEIKEVPFKTFYKCTSLKKIIIPEKVAKLGKDVFSGCTGLESMVVLNSECDLSGANTAINEDLVIYGYAGSTAQTYAEENKYEFVVIGEEPATDVQAGLLGDANTDGKLSVADAVFIMQSLSNPDEFTLNEQQALNADVLDVGGGLTTMDALVIQMIDINIISAEDLPITSEELNKLIK